MSAYRLVVTVVLLLSLSACMTQGEVIEMSPSESNFVTLTTQLYSTDELTTIINYAGDISQLNSLYPIQCIRNRQGYIRVAYRGENHLAIVYFDNMGKKSFGRIFSFSNAIFEDSQIIGQSVEAIMIFDPLGDYTFIYTGSNDYKVSKHYTRDGFEISIIYNDAYEAQNIVRDPI